MSIESMAYPIEGGHNRLLLPVQEQLSEEPPENKAFFPPGLVVLEALQKEDVLSLVKDSLETNYNRFFPGHEKAIKEMLTYAFSQNGFIFMRDSFTRIISSVDIEEVSKSFSAIFTRAFHKNDPDYWFTKEYREYKRNKRARYDFEKIRGFIKKDKRVLDFGSGAGDLALVIQEHGFDILTVDEMSYQTKEAQEKLPFEQRSTPPEGDFGTTFLISVLHHINKENLPKILCQLARVSERLIIKEDVFPPTPGVENFVELMVAQPLMRPFSQMSKEDQRRCLVAWDYFANVCGQGIIDMNMPFEFKTVDEWTETLSQHGFETNKVLFTGFEEYKLHPSCQAFLICDRKA